MGSDQRRNDDFRSTLGEFRGAMRQAGAESQNPGLQAILERGRASKVVAQLRWAAAFAVVAVVVIIPIYRQHREAERARQELAHQRQQLEDALLLQQINESLSRQVPRAMAVLMGGN